MSKRALWQHIRASALTATYFTSGLIAELELTVSDAVGELADLKADKTESVSAIIPAAGWSSDSSTSYPNYYDIPVTGVTAQDRAEITLQLDSLETAKTCGLCPTNETLVGKIRVRASSVPTSALNIEYWIEKGRG